MYSGHIEILSRYEERDRERDTFIPNLTLTSNNRSIHHSIMARLIDQIVICSELLGSPTLASLRYNNQNTYSNLKIMNVNQ